MKDKYLVPILSNHILVVEGLKIPNPYKSVYIHIISTVALTSVLYSDSVLNLKSVV
jgi:hypothetical protein